jgi:CubicO group peptidase (beta-lactamase class C family)
MLDATQIDQYFRNLDQSEFSGVALITQGTTQRFEGAYGYASRAWNIPNTLDIRFDTASITKLFTAVATLQLIDQGSLRFETSAIEFLGIAETSISKAVTVYHLLTHTSGIGDDADEEAGERYEDVWKDKPNYSVINTADFLPQFIHKPSNFAPGEGCRYCNVSFILLGLMIEKISGLSYVDYVEKHIFQPSGMLESGFYRKDRVYPKLAEGADPLFGDQEQVIGWKKNIYSFPPIGSPDGGAYVTASDLTRFLRAVQIGKLLSPSLTADFLSPHVYYADRDKWTLKMGYGLEYFVNQAGQVDFYEKEGINVGVSAVIRHYPTQDITVVLLSNMENGVWKPIWKIHEFIMAG